MSNYTQFDPAQPPPPLMTGEPGSFAHHTMTTRIPAIVQDVLTNHAGQYPPKIKQALQNLYNEITKELPVRPLEIAAADTQVWAEAWQLHQGKHWLNIPWYFAEAFFYRRLLEAVTYFDNNAAEANKWAGVDPFLPAKQAELQSKLPWNILTLALRRASYRSATGFRALLHYAVWGNRVDLSYTEVAKAAGGKIALDKEQANLLVDDTEAVLAHLQSVPPPNKVATPLESGRSSSQITISFICDNVGTELLMDLALVDFLLREDWATQITLHLKAYPTFVSDATLPDIELTLAAIENHPVADIHIMAGRLKSFQKEKRLCLKAHPFWNSSHFFWEIPAPLQQQLAQDYLVIIKGDANYRRLLGDSRWPAATPAADAIPYFPAPFVSLRTMKSDPVVGLQPGQAEKLDQIDAKWRVNGKRGLIQAVLG